MGRKEMFYLTTHSTHFIYGYMASDIWIRTILIVRNETRCGHIGYYFRLAARVLLYAPSHRHDNTYHGYLMGSYVFLLGDTGFSSINNYPDLMRNTIIILLHCSRGIAMGRRIDPHGGPLSYFSFQPMFYDWYLRKAVVCAILFVEWCIHRCCVRKE